MIFTRADIPPNFIGHILSESNQKLADGLRLREPVYWSPEGSITMHAINLVEMMVDLAFQGNTAHNHRLTNDWWN